VLDIEKVELVKAMTDETDDGIILAFLSLAGDAVYHAACPYRNSDKTSVVSEYEGVQIRAAAYYLNKRGAEGEKSHGENGISRTYENADLPNSLLREITPIVGVSR
jgi:hypothetical protein